MATAVVVVSVSKQSGIGYESRTRTGTEMRPRDPENPFWGNYMHRYQYEMRRTVVTTTETTVSEERGLTEPGMPVATSLPDLDGGGTTTDVVFQRSSEAGIYTKVTTVTTVAKRYGSWAFYGRIEAQ